MQKLLAGFDRLFRRGRGPVVVNSVPKSGTHLVARALGLMGMDTQQSHFLSAATAEQFAGPDDCRLPLGVSTPVCVSCSQVRSMLQQVPANQVVVGHVPYSAAMAEILSELDCRMLLVIRDPRDVAVSLAAHMIDVPTNALYDWAQGTTLEQRIMAAIRGIPGVGGQPAKLLDINARFRSVLPWCERDNVLMVRFEEVIGPEGGGDHAVQRAVLQRIAQHCRQGKVDIQAVQRDLFGAGPTYRQGVAGQWHQKLQAEHLTALDEIAVHLLLELGYA